MINDTEVFSDDILSGKPQIPHGAEFHTDKCIAMLHGAVAVRNTQYEGIVSKYSFKYFQQLLALPKHYLDLGITPEQLKAAQDAIADLIYFDELFDSFIYYQYDDKSVVQKKEANKLKISKKIIDTIIEIDLDKALSAIKERSKTRGHCYLPSGWIGDKIGHFSGIRVKPASDKQLLCVFLDRGAGIKNHSLMAVSGGKLKYNYESDPFIVDTNKSFGLNFLEDIIRLKIDEKVYDKKECTIEQINVENNSTVKVAVQKNNITIKHYSEDDLYGSSVKYSEKFLPPQPSKTNTVTQQRTGTCTVSNTKVVAQDAISFGFNVDLKTLKRFKFVIKLSSLIETFKAYCNKQCPYEIVNWALQEFYVRINKHYPEILSDREVILCTKIGLGISKRLTKDNAELLEQRCAAKPLPPLVGKWHALKQMLHLEENISIPTQAIKSVMKGMSLDKNGCTPEQILDYLEQARCYFDKKRHISHIIEFRCFMHSLAKTSGSTDDPYWDRVKIQHLPSVIEKLVQLVQISMSFYSHHIDSMKFEIALIAYDIAAQIAPRIPELQLSNKYALVLDDVYSEKCYFDDAITYHTVKHIVENFASRGAGKKYILSNAVNYDDTDATQEYVMNVLLTRDRYFKAINLLKEKNSIESHVTYVPENELFTILMTKLCEVKFQKVAFETQDILGNLFADLLTLSATTHHNSKLDRYSVAAQQSNIYSVKNNYQRSKLFFVDDVAFHKEIELADYLKNPTVDFNQRVGLEKHFPKIDSDRHGYADFSENTIYHPQDDLIKKRSLKSTKDKQYLSFIGTNEKNEIFPYEISLSGSLRNGSSWGINSGQNVNDYDELDEDLRSIETSTQMQVVRALEWGQYYTEKLMHDEVRKRLSGLFFRYGNMDSALASSPADTIELMNRFLTSGYDHYLKRALNPEYPDENLTVFIWLYNVHHYFLKYISVSTKLYQLNTTDYQLPCVRNFLLEKISVNNAANYVNTLSLLLAASYWNKSNLSQDDYLILLQGQIINKLTPKDSYVIHDTALRLILEKAWIEHKDALQVLLTAMLPQHLNDCINRVMKFCNESFIACEWRIENSILISTDGKHSIDLNHGQLFRGEQQQKDLFRELNSSNFEILKQLGLLNKNVIDTLYDATAECIKTIDGEYEILCPYSGSSRYIKQINRIITIEGVSRKFKLLYGDPYTNIEKVLTSFFENHNISSPFEKNLGKDFCYWLSEDSEQMLFVDHYNKPEHAFLRSAEAGWIQLIPQKNQWMSNGKVIFDFNNPQADIEKQWVSRLEKIIGNSDALVLAVILPDNQCCIESIKLSELGLEFINNNGRLASQDYPGYFLSQKQSLIQLKGLSSIIILVNDFGDEKYLVPHFGLKKSDGNSALEHEDIIDKSEINYQFTNGELHYFIYEIDRNGNLVGNNLEADAYLAVLLSALGDYEHALYALRRTEHHTNNSSSIVAIFELISIRQDQSPLGAAWAVKVASRMYRHMHKWAKHPNQFWKEKTTPKLVKFAYDQYLYYQKTVSYYKDEINIMPDYLRLEDHDVNALRALIKIREAQENKLYPLTLKPMQGVEHKVLINERLEEISSIEFCKDSSLTDWIDYKLDKLIEGLYLTDQCHGYQKNQYDLFLRTFFNKNEKIYCQNASYRVGEDFLKRYYVNFIQDAISDKAVTIKRLQAVLYGIIQNDVSFDKNNPLLTTLSFVIQNPQHFKKIFKTTTRICFKEVMKQCYECINKQGVPNEIKLFKLNNGFINYIEEAILPNVFSNINLLQFDLSNIKIDFGYQHPLDDIFKIFFNATPQPVAKGNFVLNESEMEKPSLLEKHIIKRLRSGHMVNQSKIKHVYRIISDDMLLALKKTLNIHTGHQPIFENSAQQSTELYQQSSDEIIFITQEGFKDSTTIINIKGVLKKREDDLLKLANYTPLDSDRPNEKAKAYLLLAARGGHQRSEIAIDDLILFLLTHDSAVLSRKNCFLTQQQLSHLMGKLCDYLLLQSRVDQIEEALRLIGSCVSIAELGKYKEQLLGSIFASQRTYDVKKYPEFLVYEHLTKRMLRPDQVTALTNLINLIKSGTATTENFHHALLQFAAGGGKTSVLIIILCYVFAHMGLMPVIFNTSELYDIAATDIPEYLKASLQQNMEVLERELEHKWTAAEMQKLYRDLNLWHQQKKCLLIKAITWHSINISKKIAKAETILDPDQIAENEALAKAANLILDFFKHKTIKLEDESQIISDPLQESIKTYGPMQAIPLDQQQLFVRFYDYLMNWKKDCADIAEKAGIIDKSKKVVSEKTLEFLQNKLANKICQEECFKKLNQEELLNYLLQTWRKRPAWFYQLLNQDEQTADLVILARSFIKTHLTHILSLQYAKNYGASIHEGDLTVAPKHDGMDVTSHFSDQMLVMALTIQLYAQQGVPSRYIVKIISEIEADHCKERKWNKDITDAEQFLNSILPEAIKKIMRGINPDHSSERNLNKDIEDAEQILNSSLPDNHPFIYLDGITNDDKKTMSKDDEVRFHSAMIKEFLFLYALRQVRTPKYRMVSTPADLQAGFKFSVMFSATPGLRETMPVFLQEKNCYFDTAFEAQVVGTLLQEKNAKYCIIEMTHEPKNFFGQLKSSYPDLFPIIGTLIDRGALLSNTDGKSVINAYLDAVGGDDTRSTALCFEKEFMILRSKQPRIGEIRIPGSRLLEALKRKGIKPEQFLLFLFLELSKTFGTDVKRPHNDLAGVTIGKEQTLTEIIQAAMRERLLLWEDAQTVIWIMFRSLYNEIYPESLGFNHRHIFYWWVRNEANQYATKIVMRAYQGIYQQIEEIVWNKIDKGEVQYSVYHERLQKSYMLSPSKIYEIESSIEPSKKVLEDYRDELCRLFDCPKDNLPSITTERINQIIADTCPLIEEMRQPHGAELNAQVTQEQQALAENKQEIQEEQKIKSLFDQHTHFRFNLEKYGMYDDTFDAIFSGSLFSPYQLLKLKNCNDIRIPQLLIKPNHFSPIQSEDFNLGYIQWLKPINALLVQVNQDGSMKFLACTGAGINYYCHQIKNLKDIKNGVSYVLIGIDGHVLFSTLNLTQDNKNKIMGTDILQEMVIFIAFLNGRIKNPEKLSQIVQKYQWRKEDYYRLVSAISEVHVSRRPIKLMNIPKFERLCGWRHDKPQFPQYDKDKIAHKMHVLPQQPLQAIALLPQRVCNITVENELKTALPGCIFEKQPRPRKVLPRNISLSANKPPAALPVITSARAENNGSLKPPAVPRPSFAEVSSTLFRTVASAQPDININDVRRNLLASASAIHQSELKINVEREIIGRKQLTIESLLQVANRAYQDYVAQNVFTGFFGFFQTMFSRHGETGRQNALLFLTRCRQIVDLNQMIDYISNYIKLGPGNYRLASFKSILMRTINVEFSLNVSIPNSDDVTASHINFCRVFEALKMPVDAREHVLIQLDRN